MIKDAHKYLTELGLKENDSQVYLACFQRPMGLFVHEIVELTDLKRSTIDLILQRLRKKGFISRHKQGARWVYCAESPEKISHSIHNKLNAFDEFIPGLFSMIENSALPNVRFYEGKQGIESVFDDILLNCKRANNKDHELLTISSGKDIIQLLPDHHKKFIQKRVRHSITTRMLAPNNKTSQAVYKSDPRHLRQTHFFDEQQYSFTNEIDIYAHKVALMNFAEPGIMATVIESKSIAESMRALFDMLWVFTQE